MAQPKYTSTALGDSQTNLHAGYGTRASRMWHPQAGAYLLARGALVKARTFGVSGETTTQMLTRADILFKHDTPNVVFIDEGVNDPGASISQATTQANIQAAIKAAKFGCTGSGNGMQTVLGFTGSPTGGTFTVTVTVQGSTASTAALTYTTGYTAATLQTALQALANVGAGNALVVGPNGGPFTITIPGTLAPNLVTVASALTGGTSPAAFTSAGVTVASQAHLPAGGKLGQRYVVMTDTSSTGGPAAWHSTQLATITGAGGSAQTVWEYRNPLAGEFGWARVATAATTPTVCKMIAVNSTNYLNFTTGGDTPSTPYASYATVRAAQQAAVTAENVNIGGVPTVVYIDLYTFMKNRIVAGTDPDFSTVAYDQIRSWHYTQNNQHHSEYGNAVKAQAAVAGLPAAWLTALSS